MKTPLNTARVAAEDWPYEIMFGGLTCLVAILLSAYGLHRLTGVSYHESTPAMLLFVLGSAALCFILVVGAMNLLEIVWNLRLFGPIDLWPTVLATWTISMTLIFSPAASPAPAPSHAELAVAVAVAIATTTTASPTAQPAAN